MSVIEIEDNDGPTLAEFNVLKDSDGNITVELINKPNIVIEIEDGLITGVSSDYPEKLGEVVVLDTSETIPSDPDLISVTGNGFTGYGVILAVEQRSVAELIKNIMEQSPISD